MRVGTGWDIHRLVEQKPLFIGGVHIQSNKGSLAHSDGDVLIHAIIDALLGAASLKDIGYHFPPNDEKYKNIKSTLLLKETLLLLKDYSIVNIDCTIILQQIILKPFIDDIIDSLSAITGIEKSRISVKAKTAEQLLGEVGSGDAIIAQAVVLIEEKDSLDDTENLYWV